jgi:recombination protein RecA
MGKSDDEVLQKTIDKILQQYGEGSVQQIGKNDIPKRDSYSTGSLGLDIALGIGGFPRGRVSEVIGPESSGKTTICLQAVRDCQRQGGIAHYIDMEHGLDLDYASRLGVDIDRLYISQPDYGEQALEIADSMISSGKVNIVVIDSVAALVPKAEIEGEMGDSHMGLHARLMSQALRKLVAKIDNNNVAVIFTNQWREKIGIMFGDNKVPTGGNALKFYASVRIEFTKSVSSANLVKDGDDVLGNLVTARVIKNKCASPFKKAEFDILYGSGVNRNGELVNIGQKYSIVTKRGAFFSYGDLRLGQGFDNACNFLKQNQHVAQEIESKIYNTLKTGEIPISAQISEEAE